MADNITRVSQIGAMVEYNDIHMDRMSQVGVMFEYDDIHYDRISQLGLMVEYSDYIPVEYFVQMKGFQELTGNIRDMRG